jgi:photosynthesis system II assembly factor YCF48-like protein
MKKFKLLSLLLLTLIILTGCISFKGGSDKEVNVGPFGIYKSTDSSVSWQTINKVSNAEGKKLTLNGIGISKIIFDPSDNETIYLTTNTGLFYSLDAGNSWQRDALFNSAKVTGIAINPSDKCTIYLTAGQSIYKTDDCLRNWREVYFDKSRSDLLFTDVETDSYNPNVIYVTNNYGDILKSVDHGKTWKVVKRVGNYIRHILIDKDDTRVVYFVTAKKGIFKTMDGGTTWSSDSKETDINEALDKFKDSEDGLDLIQDMTRNNSFVYVSKNGLLRTNDGGMNWEKIKLLAPPKDGIIYSFAIDPKDSNRIFYGTLNTLYKSADAGVNWSTQKSPSNSLIDYLVFDPEDSKIMYMGMRVQAKK